MVSWCLEVLHRDAGVFATSEPGESINLSEGIIQISNHFARRVSRISFLLGVALHVHWKICARGYITRFTHVSRFTWRPVSSISNLHSQPLAKCPFYLPTWFVDVHKCTRDQDPSFAEACKLLNVSFEGWYVPLANEKKRIEIFTFHVSLKRSTFI